MSEENKFDESSAFAGLEDLAQEKTDDNNNNTSPSAESTSKVEDLFDPELISGKSDDNTGGNADGGEGDDKPAETLAGDKPAGDVNADIELTDAHRMKFMNEMFGDRFSTVDELKNSKVVEQLDELPSLRERSSQLEKQLQENYNPFANDEIAKYNHFVKETGIADMKVYSKISSIDSETDPIDILVANHIIDNPQYANREGELKTFLMDKYKLDPEEYSEEEIKKNKFALELESGTAVKKINELKDKLDGFQTVDFEAVAKQREEQAKQEQEKLASGWSEVVAKLPSHIPAFKVDLGEGKGDFEYAYTEEQRKDVEKEVLDYLVGNRLPLTKESVNSALVFAQSRVYHKNQQDIYKSFYEKISNDVRTQYDKEFVNPSALNGGNKTQEKKTEKSDADMAFELAMKGI